MHYLLKRGGDFKKATICQPYGMSREVSGESNGNGWTSEYLSSVRKGVLVVCPAATQCCVGRTGGCMGDCPPHSPTIGAHCAMWYQCWMLKKCISGTQNRQTLKITLQYKRRKKLIIFVPNLQEHFVMIKFLFRSLKAVQYCLGVHRNIYECHRLSSIEKKNVARFWKFSIRGLTPPHPPFLSYGICGELFLLCFWMTIWMLKMYTGNFLLKMRKPKDYIIFILKPP